MEDIILADKGDEQKVIEEEKEAWVYKVLMALGVSEDVLELDNEDIVSYLTSINIEIFNNCDGTVDILREDKLIAQWKTPRLVLIKEGFRKFYYEIHLNEWALPFQMKRITK